jgi:hypothetical protein
MPECLVPEAGNLEIDENFGRQARFQLVRSHLLLERLE